MWKCLKVLRRVDPPFSDKELYKLFLRLIQDLFHVSVFVFFICVFDLKSTEYTHVKLRRSELLAKFCSVLGQE